ncbi:MAG: FAD-binding oxidoreductase [Acidimicrobiia bacterium]
MRPETMQPGSPEEAAGLLASATAGGKTVRFRGGGTKLGWGGASDCDLAMTTAGLDRLLEHSPGDLTAVVEAGMSLQGAQEAFAEHGQMLAFDPPLGEGAAATLGGSLATGDSGPLRHQYGSGRDLVLGVRFALANGTLARSGGKVIKNVAGYDLAKLFSGAFGTLGLIVEVALRLHPIPRRRATVIASSESPAALQHAAFVLAKAPLEAESLDLYWGSRDGAVLMRFSGVDPRPRCARAADLIADCGLRPEIVEDDSELWERQRAAQRDASGRGAVVRVSGLTGDLATMLSAATSLSATLAARAALGIGWIRLAPGSIDDLAGSVGELRRRLAPLPCVVLDAPTGLSDRVDAFGEIGRAEMVLMRRIKARFDPSATCNPGVFAGGI